MLLFLNVEQGKKASYLDVMYLINTPFRLLANIGVM